ncbi:MAG: precorrin-2 C(20)-methyltransferase [Desulfurivibrionaceae bacterium]|jgi:precorrin-2/cobalt-factor-2 C20-methyltransferase
MKGTLYVVGVGPGDPELMTLKAVRILERCGVWLAPAAKKDGESTALGIVEGVVKRGNKEIITHHFPMKKVRMGESPDPEVKKAWNAAAAQIVDHLQAGRDVAFPTLGDPAIYSTGFYVCETLFDLAPDLPVEIIPGVSAIGASAAAAGQPLCLGDDRLVVIPATFENGRLRETLEQFDSVVLMKVHRVMDRLVPLLTEMNLLDKAVLVERSSQSGQRIRRDLTTALTGNNDEPHYFSTIIVRKS